MLEPTVAITYIGVCVCECVCVSFCDVDTLAIIASISTYCFFLSYSSSRYVTWWVLTCLLYTVTAYYKSMSLIYPNYGLPME